MLRNAGHLESVKKLRIKEKDLAASQEYYQVRTTLLWLQNLKTKLVMIDRTSKPERNVCSDFKPIIDNFVTSLASAAILLFCPFGSDHLSLGRRDLLNRVDVRSRDRVARSRSPPRQAIWRSAQQRAQAS